MNCQPFTELNINILYVVFTFNAATTHEKFVRNDFYECHSLKELAIDV